ncbi:MAG TPA: efflux RND transporter periplasmic adaptor subunit [Nevskia sp.]|nr:efflux RND transporter periplasmic adaptor subunit [Nevskia sp.]
MLWSDPGERARVARRAALAAVCALGLAACGHGDGAEEGSSPPQLVRNGDSIQVPEQSELRKYLVVAPAQQRQIQAPLAAPAVLEADPSRVASILPPVAGRITALLVRLGDAVKAGQPLLTMDSPDLAQARADLQHAQITLAQTRKALAREQDLAEHHIAAQKDLEQAEADYGNAQSEYQRAAAVFTVLGLSAESTGSPRQLTLRSPLAGRVSALNAVPGTYANDSNAALMTVSDISTIWFTAGVQEKDLAAVTPGEEIEAEVQSFPGEVFEGRVQFVADQLDADTRTVKVRVAHDNADGRLKPGMFARLSFRAAPRPAIVVPTTALIQQESRTLVYIETAPWTFQAREVATGVSVGDQTEVVKGLAVGERIVARQGVLLND